MTQLTRTLILLLLLASGEAMATTYYVDAEQGNDRHRGTSPRKAWQSLAKVSATTFEPGDSILFRRGSVWSAQEPLRPQGSGDEGRPIVIAAYGEGGRPLIVGKGFTGAGVISLCNQSHWVISQLELTNWAAEVGDRRGIEIQGRNGGLLRGIHILDMDIHHIKGIVGQNLTAKRTAAVEFVVTDAGQQPTRFDDLLVERCYLHHIENQGIVLSHADFGDNGYPGDERWAACMFTNVVIRHNVIHDISKNAMIIRMTEGGVVEHNTCFATSTMERGGNTIFSRNVRGTLFQYNEGFLNRSPDHDGSLYDPDLSSPATVWRYSYSHDNAHGLVWFCTTKPDREISVYGNVSENDRGYLVYFNYTFHDARVERNLFYAGPYVQPYLYRVNRKNWHGYFALTDNLVWNESPRMGYEYLYQGSVAEGSREDVRDNEFVGTPLVGDYHSEAVDRTHFRPFHRGFLHTTPLDEVVGNRVEIFEPETPPQSQIVGWVNRQPIYRFEWERELARNRWRAADCRGDEAELVIRRAALWQLTLIKVQIEEMAARGMREAAVAADIERLRAREEAFRSKTSREEVMWFGPDRFAPDAFWEGFFAMAQEELKRLMTDQHFATTDEELRAHFDAKQKYGWLRRGYDYSLRAIRRSLIHQKYTTYFEQRAAAAEVVIAPAYYDLSAK